MLIMGITFSFQFVFFNRTQISPLRPRGTRLPPVQPGVVVAPHATLMGDDRPRLILGPRMRLHPRFMHRGWRGIRLSRLWRLIYRHPFADRLLSRGVGDERAGPVQVQVSVYVDNRTGHEPAFRYGGGRDRPL